MTFFSKWPPLKTYFPAEIDQALSELPTGALLEELWLKVLHPIFHPQSDKVWIQLAHELWATELSEGESQTLFEIHLYGLYERALYEDACVLLFKFGHYLTPKHFTQEEWVQRVQVVEWHGSNKAGTSFDTVKWQQWPTEWIIGLGTPSSNRSTKELRKVIDQLRISTANLSVSSMPDFLLPEWQQLMKISSERI